MKLADKTNKLMASALTAETQAAETQAAETQAAETQAVETCALADVDPYESYIGRALGAYRADKHDGYVCAFKRFDGGFEAAQAAALQAFGLGGALVDLIDTGSVSLTEIADGIWLPSVTVNSQWGSRSDFDAEGAWRNLTDRAIAAALRAVIGVEGARQALIAANYYFDYIASRACEFSITPCAGIFSKRVTAGGQLDKYVSEVRAHAYGIAYEVIIYCSALH